MSYAGKIEDLIAERDSLRNDRDALQDAVISRDVTIETLRQRVKELEAELESLSVHAGRLFPGVMIHQLFDELATLKQAQEPALYQCTKCGGANYGCTCDSLKDCTAPLYANPTIPDAHELWAAAQLMPDEGIEDGVERIHAMLSAAPKPGKPS